MSCSFFVPYKVDYHLYVQSQGTGVTDNANELYGAPWLSNNQYFTGGSSVLFEAGDTSPAGIDPHPMPPEQVQNVFEGDWGVGGTIYEYEYNVVPVEWYRYEVDCYCMENCDCTCDQVTGDEDYFIDLIASGTPNIQVIKNGRHTHLAINGTYDSAYVGPIDEYDGFDDYDRFDDYENEGINDDPYYYEDDPYFQEDDVYYECYEDEDCYEYYDDDYGYMGEEYYAQHKPEPVIRMSKKVYSAARSIYPIFWLAVLSFLSVVLTL